MFFFCKISSYLLQFFLVLFGIQRRMTKKRNIKTENIFSALQKDDTKPLREEEESPQIVKTDKDGKKIYEGKERGRIRKAHRERKGESEAKPNPRLQKWKCHIERYKYKTKECLELHEKLHQSQQGREKYKNLKR